MCLLLNQIGTTKTIPNAMNVWMLPYEQEGMVVFFAFEIV